MTENIIAGLLDINPYFLQQNEIPSKLLSNIIPILASVSNSTKPNENGTPKDIADQNTKTSSGSNTGLVAGLVALVAVLLVAGAIIILLYKRYIIGKTLY